MLLNFKKSSILAIVFHDCVSDACDGCINLDNDSNAGLEDIITSLDELYVGNYDDAMSRADFWAVAAIEAVNIGVRKANGGKCNFGE